MAADLLDLGDLLGDLAGEDDECGAAFDKTVKLAPIIIQKAVTGVPQQSANHTVQPSGETATRMICYYCYS